MLNALTAERLDGPQWTPADRALLEYGEKLTRTPAAMTRADVTRLRSAGFDDRAIHDACAIVGYFAFVNRIAVLGHRLHTRPTRKARRTAITCPRIG